MNRSGLIKFTPSETPDIGFPDFSKGSASKKSAADEGMSSGKVTGLEGNATVASRELYDIEANISAVTSKFEKVLRGSSDPDSGLASQEGHALSKELTSLYFKRASLLNIQPLVAKEAEEWYTHQEKLNQNNAGGQYTTNYPGMESIVFGGGTVQNEMDAIYKMPSISKEGNTGMYNFDKRTMPSYYEGRTLQTELSAQKTDAVKFSTETAFSMRPLFEGPVDLSGAGDYRFFYQSGTSSDNSNYLKTLIKDIPILISEDAKREAYDKLNKELRGDISEYMNLMEGKPDGSDPEKLTEWNKRYYASGRFGQDVASDDEMSYAQLTEKVAYQNIYEATDILSLSNDLIDPKKTEEERKASKDKLIERYEIKFTGDPKTDSDNLRNAYSVRQNTADRKLVEVADLSYLKFLEGQVKSMLKTEESLNTSHIGLSNASKFGIGGKKPDVVPVHRLEAAATVGVIGLPGVSYNIHNVYGKSVYLPTAHSNETLDMFGQKLDNVYFVPKLSTGRNSIDILSEGGHPLGVSQKLIDDGNIKVNIPQNYKLVDVPIEPLTDDQLKLNNSFSIDAWQLAEQLAISKKGSYTMADIRALYMEKYKNDPAVESKWEIAKGIIYKDGTNNQGKKVKKRITKAELEALIPVSKAHIYATMYISDDLENMDNETRSTSGTQGIELDTPWYTYNSVIYNDYNEKGEEVRRSATYIKESDDEVKKADKHPMEGYWEMQVLIPLENINLAGIEPSKLGKEKQKVTSADNIETIKKQGSK